MLCSKILSRTYRAAVKASVTLYVLSRSHVLVSVVWGLGLLVTSLSSVLHQTDSQLWSWCEVLPGLTASITSTAVTSLLTSTFILPTLLMTVIYTKIYLEAHNSSERTRKCSLKPAELVLSPPSSNMRHRQVSSHTWTVHFILPYNGLVHFGWGP